MAFNSDLSPATQRRLTKLHEEALRLYRLPDRWLAQELLRLARRARLEQPEHLHRGRPMSYATSFVWHLLPNLAERLGATDFRPGENAHPDIVSAEGPFLRELVSSYMQNHGLSTLPQQRERNRPSAIDIITRDPANGNPIAIALDRVAPALVNGKPSQDWLARYIQEISNIRGRQPRSHWHPDMQLPGRTNTDPGSTFGYTPSSNDLDDSGPSMG